MTTKTPSLVIGGTNWASKEAKLLGYYQDDNEFFNAVEGDFSRASSKTVVNRDKIIEVLGVDVASIDFQENIDGALKLETQSTNLIYYSEDFSQSSWNLAGVVLTSNYSTSPNGTLNATRVTGSSSISLLQMFVYLENQSETLTLSFYAKGTGKFRMKNTHGGVVDNFSSNYDATSDWERYSYTITNNSSASGVQIVGLVGNTMGTAYDLSIWGMQLEIGSVPTSIIPTNGSAVTRVQDLASNFGNVNTFNSEEGVLFVEMAALSDDGTYRQLTISGAGNNEINILFNSNGTIGGVVRVAGAYVVNISGTVSDVLAFNKIAFKYKENDFALWINGVKVATDFIGSVPNTATELMFNHPVGLNYLYAKVKQVQVYKEALTDSELEYLTTYGSYTDLANSNNYNLILDI